MSKNDLRFQKTEIAIKKTYLALKKKGSTVVKVKDLCDAAMINKTTFYAHYETIDHLHKEICNEFVSQVLTASSAVEKFKTDIRACLYSVLGLFIKNMSSIKKLYGDNYNDFVNDFEKLFLKAILDETSDENYAVAVRFCIGGAFRILVEEDDPRRIEKTLVLVEKVMYDK